METYELEMLFEEKTVEEKDEMIIEMFKEVSSLKMGKECDDAILIQVFDWFKENNYNVTMSNGKVKIEKKLQ